MPQNTPMKRQFTTIDGRTVMSNLPQHWGANDWAITGVDNPLPVGNYIQTDSGVWIPQKGSDDGAADVRLTGRYVEDEDIGIEEGIYNDDITTHVFSIPSGVKGAVIFVRASGLTGTFESGQGVMLRARVGVTGNWLLNLSTDFIRANTFNGALIFSQGVKIDNLDFTFASSVVNVASLDLTGFNFIQISIFIRGEMGEGEGAHITNNTIRWIY